ncbi:uncharacterized protein LOC110706745 [Chenopodium quinoa]|uniref:uncharacterized protein LOC110706745 n=1 Tax=Chenopodium quinoa TaxID=63459 RepID=UPI000B77DFB3|nr:uncharacterized protein LOC110706745 [Chenopodium quinoa]
MRKLKGECSTPCLFFGDFNEISSSLEKEGGAMRRECLMQNFRDAIEDCNLRDMGFKGCAYTWQRGRTVETVIRERLDRFLGDEAWCNMFPQAEVKHMVRIASDHAPIMMSTTMIFDRGKKSRPFRFEAWWLSSSECTEVVEKTWRENADAMPHEKVAWCASSLKSWAQKKFGDIRKRLRDCEKELKEVQGGILDGFLLEKCERL